jgi:hypothetical protein
MYFWWEPLPLARKGTLSPEKITMFHTGRSLGARSAKQKILKIKNNFLRKKIQKKSFMVKKRIVKNIP